MTIEALKKKIKNKFGSYASFARAAGIDYYELQKSFLSAHKIEKRVMLEMALLCDETDPNGDGAIITDNHREDLRKMIDSWGGVSSFCEKHSDIPEVSVFQVLNGTRKTMTPKVKELIEKASNF